MTTGDAAVLITAATGLLGVIGAGVGWLIRTTMSIGRQIGKANNGDGNVREEIDLVREKINSIKNDVEHVKHTLDFLMHNI